MGYMHAAERYAAMVGSGTMTLDAAAAALSAETDGELTPLGAADVISDPAAAAMELANALDDARVGIDRYRQSLDG